MNPVLWWDLICYNAQAINFSQELIILHSITSNNHRDIEATQLNEKE